jgi:hypothetical protein
MTILPVRTTGRDEDECFLEGKNLQQPIWKTNMEHKERAGMSQRKPLSLLLQGWHLCLCEKEGWRSVYASCDYLSVGPFLFQEVFSSFQNSTHTDHPGTKQQSRDILTQESHKGGGGMQHQTFSLISFFVIVFNMKMQVA